MKHFVAVITFFTVMLSAVHTQAAAWYEETMYSSGKIYVVVAVVVVVLIGIFTYLILMDKRLKKLEEQHLKQE